MPTIHITIATDNAAFEDAGGEEVARILRELADRYETEGTRAEGALHDINGNIVGRYGRAPGLGA